MNHNQKRQIERKSGVNPVAVGVVGAIAGAGIAVAGAMALRNDENRKQVSKVINDVKDVVLNKVNEASEQIREKKKEVSTKGVKIVTDLKKELK